MLDTHGAERQPWTITADAEALLRTYAWPGNVRELSNVMQRALVLSHSSLITAAHLSFDEFGVLDNSSAENRVPLSAAAVVDTRGPDLDSAVRVSQHRAILAALRAASSRNEAARVLGISPRTLRYKLAQLKDHGFTLAMAETA